MQQRQQIASEWDKLAFGEVQTKAVANGYLCNVALPLDTLTPDQVLVEFYAQGPNGTATQRIPLQPDAHPAADGYLHYQALVSTARPASDFTARILPAYEGIAVPLEDQHICWQPWGLGGRAENNFTGAYAG